MNYIISSLFNILLVQFKELPIDLKKIFTEYQTELNVLQNPISKIDANIMGMYLEEVVKQTDNKRIGLEVGFLIPFMLSGSFFNIYNNHKTAGELLQNLDVLDSTANNITIYKIRVEGGYLHYDMAVKQWFIDKYPIGAQIWYEMQYGIALQYAYSFTGRMLHPISAQSPYNKKGNIDLLEEYLGCPVMFNQRKAVLTFNQSVLDLPVITAKKELLPIFENVMGEIEYKLGGNELSKAVRRYLMHSLSVADLNLNKVAKRFNMSERTLQRKLKLEGVSYQQILDNLRMELAQKYLHEKIPLVEVAFLLGFESQSAFNKFFRKYFDAAPKKLKQ